MNSYPKSYFLHSTFLILVFLFSCSSLENSSEPKTDPSKGINRPMEPWVFRSVLDEKPRMITLALDQNLFVAYSTQDGSLYKAWKGRVELDGAVYTTHHGPQPTSVGNDYFINKYKQPWNLYKGDRKSQLNVKYAGHRFENNEVTLLYNLIGESETFRLEEQPRYKTTGTGVPIFERTFTVSDMPEGYTITFMTNYASLMGGEAGLRSNGRWKYAEDAGKGIKRELALNPSGTTTLSLLLSEPTIINEEAALATDLSPAQKLINAHDCRSCHNEKLKTVGPAYIKIAEKYRNNENNIVSLMNKVKYGGVGVWGESVMNAHPEIPNEDLRIMVSYIMDLDSEEENIKAALLNTDPIDAKELIRSDKSVSSSDLDTGLKTAVYRFEGDKESITDIDFAKVPTTKDALDFIDLTAAEFGELQDKFALVCNGYLKVEEDQRLVLRIASDDGSRLFLHGKELINNDGLHGTQARDATVALEAGYHPIKIDYYENGGGQSFFFQWRTSTSGEFVTVPSSALYFRKDPSVKKGSAFKAEEKSAGDASPLSGVHPSYNLTQARPHNFEPRVGGLDFLSDGRAVVSTWDAAGGVYIIDKVAAGDSSRMSAKRIASGLAEPLGLKVVDDVIYIMQKQEMTKLIDYNGDDYIDEYQVLSNNWDVTANFHEFGFGLEHKDGHFYATLATGIQPGGASALNQPKHRGSVIKVAEDTGETEFLANGLRTPNGIGIGVDNEVFVADNEGDWLPSCKILHVKKDAWYGSRSVDFEGTAGLTEMKPVVWLPHNEIGNSPGTPTYINDGPYKGQMIHGEVTHGGIKRVFVEKVDGEYQGCVFRFCQGLEAGVNRLSWGPDGALYAGGVGSTGNWQQDRKLWFGLQRLEYNKKSTFEMLSVSARTNGIEIEFTEPLAEDSGNHPGNYEIKQWYYLPTKEYGGPKMDETHLDIYSVNVSADRKKVFLELGDMKDNHVIYVHLLNPMISQSNKNLWSTEGWYTMNSIPKNLPGNPKEVDSNMNALSASEKADGWQLLFDGKTTKGWRNFNKQSIGSSWKVINGEFTLLVTKKPDGAWQAADGGDIITDSTYENYELQLEWKIADCGNSGIIYNVHEGGDFDYVWQTGPEMQILDNVCHPDAEIKTHRAGDLYDMIACRNETFSGANEWNKVKLIVNNGKTEHWLNGEKVVEFEMFTPQWKEMIANSKFHTMEGFGTYKQGHIALQDHGDRVAFRNIKIKKL